MLRRRKSGVFGLQDPRNPQTNMSTGATD